MILYGLKTCDTCRKALKSLAEDGCDVSFHDVREAPLTRDRLVRFHARFGAALVNRRSTTWRALDADARGGDPVALIEEYPTLMKRPVIESDGTLHLGWGPETRAALSRDRAASPRS